VLILLVLSLWIFLPLFEVSAAIFSGLFFFFRIEHSVCTTFSKDSTLWIIQTIDF
jgi:Na+-transporting NADH:ubiquinone oxidoreductase subunit NqrE